ncbi:RNA polymerase-associated protein LEO1-like [Strongylocentrotus purpuratus]|uniref:Uncharacterized protein n=1 Tax=Strongylocentrotus purpuratus TaxID=7668 RepID=A0A7M7RFS4_STRPU|nr:RNA polymerase-associated protein LEO1-like [Strongylocentrotus purpuratus]
MNTFKMSIILIVSLCLLMTIGQSEARRYGKKNMRKIDDGGMERDRVERSLGSDSNSAGREKRSESGSDSAGREKRSESGSDSAGREKRSESGSDSAGRKKRSLGSDSDSTGR